jgi:hypothetical protein
MTVPTAEAATRAITPIAFSRSDGEIEVEIAGYID